jgi:hypothetical protein
MDKKFGIPNLREDILRLFQKRGLKRVSGHKTKEITETGR